MALEQATPPPEAAQLVVDALARLAAVGGGAADAVKPEALNRLSLAVPHPVYLVDTVDITSGKQLEAARLVAWRFLVLDRQTAVGAVELACDPDGKNLKFASFNVGPFVQETQTAVNRAEQLDEVKNGSYELRALRLPSVYVMSLWLKNKGQGKDLMVIMNPPGSVNPISVSALGGAPGQTHLDSSNFFKALRPLAQTARVTNTALGDAGGAGPPPGPSSP
jgi:hypothetical protein